ncbi:hypothetical protein J7F01_27170 [Streptomyces sp. ISL-22]|uniref:DUF6777 domain-containing protein n=1 Tax=unclassified Streptomyces TaxID=2593676 RepID=UPI001BE5E333|nr:MULTISPECIES: DUF6777 domain-containing protein [unclassified Streptomyces]MBT2416479.1 hypothetical protein [Streptomyces sp. ISL-24]MBT2435784.1 hypothetical protein [Streptomyces sp. ISL-22]
MRTPTGTLVTACALSAALVVAGCGGNGDKDKEPSGKVFLQPAAEQGPDPFTDSTATSTAAPSPVTRTPSPARSGRTGPQSLSGGTPGLYAGTHGTGSCDVPRQIAHLTSDQARGRVFAQAAGIPQTSIPGYLRGLTSVVLRADTRVTNHGFRDGRGTHHQSVLQAGTAVLVDSRGVPRVRCACGNPLAPPAEVKGTQAVSGRPWPGYRPNQVIVVAPATQVITNITIIDITHNTWIERPTGHRGHERDHALPRPKPVTPVPNPHDSASSDWPGDDGTPPTGESATPSGGRTSPEESPADCVTPTVTVTPGATDDMRTEPPPATPKAGPADCPTATVTTPPSTTRPDSGLTSPEETGVPDSGTAPETSPGSSQEVGPDAVPDTPDLPDGGGLIPDAPDSSDSIFGSPTDVFDG